MSTPGALLLAGRRIPGLRAAGTAAAIAAATASLAACGSSTTTASPSTTSTTASAAAPSAGANRLAAFDSCMESKGIPASALPTGKGRAASGSATPTPPSTTPGQTFPAGGGFPARGGSRGGGIGRVPTSLPAGVTTAEYTSALSACRSTLPTFGGPAVNSPAFTAYRQCLQLHGLTVPAGPRGAGATSTTTAPAETTTTVSAATRQAAMAACAPLRPAAATPGAGGSTSTTTPTAAG